MSQKRKAEIIHSAGREYHQAIKSIKTKWSLKDEREVIASEIANKYGIRPDFFIQLITPPINW